MKMQKTVIEYGGYLCRRCFDRRYDIHLSHRDVREIDGICPCCKKPGRLVADLKLGGKIKMIGKR